MGSDWTLVHVGFVVADLDQAAASYRKLGATEVGPPPHPAATGQG